MILSMTGFGRGEAEEDGSQAIVEIRSVNNRFCVVTVRMPKLLSYLESKVVELVQRRISRGRVNVAVTWKGEREDREALSVDLELARAYRDNLLILKKDLQLPGQVDISLLSALPDVFKYEAKELDAELAWGVVQRACQMALDEHQRMRRAEGEKLCQDLARRIAVLDETVAEIEQLAPLRVRQERDRLKDRIEKLLLSGEADEQRLAMETAIFAEKSDVTEECVRFHSHNSQFLAALTEENAVGRKLDFLLQEMNREANTIGSKASDASISHLVVKLKEEIEKLREQVQNIE